jgi:hypothetical protein
MKDEDGVVESVVEVIAASNRAVHGSDVLASSTVETSFPEIGI